MGTENLPISTMRPMWETRQSRNGQSKQAITISGFWDILDPAGGRRSNLVLSRSDHAGSANYGFLRRRFAMSEVVFTFVDIEGNTLQFDSLRYERPGASGSDGKWINCRVTFNVTTFALKEIHYAVDASFLTDDLSVLRRTVEAALGGDEVQYESTEPWVDFKFSREDNHINILTRLSIALGGPIIEFNFECREDEVSNTLRDLVMAIEAFPVAQVDA
jgi:hypothetical protein